MRPGGEERQGTGECQGLRQGNITLRRQRVQTLWEQVPERTLQHPDPVDKESTQQVLVSAGSGRLVGGVVCSLVSPKVSALDALM